MKIAIIGYSGAGKSTLARQLGTYYQIPVLHLDQVNFLPGWKDRELSDSRHSIAAFMKQPSWVIDGNWKKFLQERRLKEADQILFLNFPRFYCLLQVIKRYRKYKGCTRPDMGDGCTEKLDAAFIRWILWEGRTQKHRLHYQNIIQQYPGKVKIFKRRRQVKQFLDRLEKGLLTMALENINH